MEETWITAIHFSKCELFTAEFASKSKVDLNIESWLTH